MTAYPGQNPPLTRTMLGQNLHHPMGLPITAGCDTAQDKTRVCGDASSTEMQCLRLLRHSGVYLNYNAVIRINRD